MDGGVSLLMDVAGICLSALRLACLCLDAKEETLHRTERATLGTFPSTTSFSNTFILKETSKTQRC